MKDSTGFLQSKTDSQLVGCYIDPPSGWRYGFPKLFQPRDGETLEKWLLREGYPITEIDFALNHLRVIDKD